jgi:23S rRNA pseudouridine2605 synthase
VTALRLARFLARAGVVSRRGAAALVAAGRVRINGRPPVGPGDPVEPGRDTVTVDGRPVRPARLVWLALHKPPGYVTSRRAEGRFPSVFDLLPRESGLVTVGRLDAYSEGLLLATTDGAAAHRLAHPRWQVARTYRVMVAGALPGAARAALARGIALPDDAPVRPSRWRFAPGPRGGTLELELREGRSRVVRRVCATLGLGVRRLIRVGYGPVQLGALAAGASRPLTSRETAALYRAIGLTLPSRPAAD